MHKPLHTATLLTALLAACAIALPASAQQNQQDQQQQRQQQQRQQQQGRQQQGRQQMQRQQQRDQGRQFALQPEGWVTIGVDYDQDRRFDAIETVYYFDLMQATERSRQRRGQQGRQQQARQQQGRRQRQDMRRVSGQVTDLITIRLTDGQRHRLAKIETQQGRRIPVDLGRVEQIQQLNLQQGDRVTIVGRRARINDRPVLCARRIQTQDQRMTIGRERDRGLKRVRGQITDLRTTRFRGRDQQFRVAQVNLRGGRTETVILGPQDRLQQLDLQQGDQVRLLVRPGRLNDQMALIAEQVRANERTVRVQDPQGRRFTARRQQRQQQQQQQ